MVRPAHNDASPEEIQDAAIEIIDTLADSDFSPSNASLALMLALEELYPDPESLVGAAQDFAKIRKEHATSAPPALEPLDEPEEVEYPPGPFTDRIQYGKHHGTPFVKVKEGEPDTGNGWGVVDVGKDGSIRRVWILDPLDFALMDGVVDINDEANAAVQSLVQWIGADPGELWHGEMHDGTMGFPRPIQWPEQAATLARIVGDWCSAEIHANAEYVEPTGERGLIDDLWDTCDKAGVPADRATRALIRAAAMASPSLEELMEIAGEEIEMRRMVDEDEAAENAAD